MYRGALLPPIMMRPHVPFGSSANKRQIQQVPHAGVYHAVRYAKLQQSLSQSALDVTELDNMTPEMTASGAGNGPNCIKSRCLRAKLRR
jgi:hypothetical protein